MSAYNGSLRTYNELYRKGDEIYHSAVKAFDISDGAFWVLYTLRDIGPQPTQRDVYKSTCMPKQTVNSAVKKLSEQGILKITPSSYNLREKLISFTEKGELFASKTVAKLMEAERTAFEKFSEEEREASLALSEKQLRFMREEFSKLDGENK